QLRRRVNVAELTGAHRQMTLQGCTLAEAGTRMLEALDAGARVGGQQAPTRKAMADTAAELNPARRRPRLRQRPTARRTGELRRWTRLVSAHAHTTRPSRAANRSIVGPSSATGW